MPPPKKRGAAGGSWIPTQCTKADLAVLFDISTRAVTDWDQKGILVRMGRGYATIPSIHAYIKALRDRATEKQSSTGRSLADERAESERVSRQIDEIKLAKMRGEVMTLDEVSASWSMFAAAVKAAVLSVPGKARSSIPHLTPHDAETLRSLCRDILSELAEEVEAAVVSGDPEQISADGMGDLPNDKDEA